MKKICILLLLSLLFACNSDKPALPESSESPASPVQTKSTDGFIFVYNNTNVYMNENMADVLTKIGEPRFEPFEAPSCAFDGIDRIYSYYGVEIHTYSIGDEDFVHMVNFKDDSLSTPEGIHLGSSLAEMLNAYGNEYEKELGQYKYKKGNTYLSFLINSDDMVITVRYELIM
jgi:hypothetical protein